MVSYPEDWGFVVLCRLSLKLCWCFVLLLGHERVMIVSQGVAFNDGLLKKIEECRKDEE